MRVSYKKNPVATRDLLVHEIGACAHYKDVLNAISGAIHCKLESMSWEEAQKKKQESEAFAHAWEEAKKEGLWDNVMSFSWYIYNEDEKTVKEVTNIIDYVKVIGCETAFVKYPLTCKPIVDALMELGEYSRKEIGEFWDIIDQLK